MRDRSYELIMAYHDKELNQEQSVEVEQILSDSTEAREFLSQLQQSDEFIRNGLGDILRQPVPKQLLEAACGKSAESRTESKALMFLKGRSVRRWAYATAASVTLAVLAGTYMLAGKPDLAQSELIARALNEALEVTTSGDIYRVSDKQVQVMPIATFETTKAGVCRQFAVQFQGQQRVGLACRQQNSQWQIRAQQTLASGSQSDLYAPASGAEEGPIADELEALGGGQPLDVGEEQTLISGGWYQ